jgi:tetratricopeptide (TPR) repeat protein
LSDPSSVFLSYAHADDAAWTKTLAENLRQDGFDVFFDQWDIAIGDVVIERLDDGLARATSGLIVCGLRTRESRWVAAEYAVLADRAIRRGHRLIPVLVADVDLPPILASRMAADFRGSLTGPDYRRRLDQLERALRAEPPVRREADVTLEVAPDLSRRPEGPRRAALLIGPDQVTLRAGGAEAVARHDGPGQRVLERTWIIDRARRGARTAARSAGSGTLAGGVGAPSQRALVQAGQALGERFLAGPVGELLGSELAVADQQNAALRIGLEIPADGGLQAFPWETLCLPGSDQPLALHPRTQLYRLVAGLGSTPATNIPGPLRILAAIGAPDAGGEGTLDYEAELDRIVRAVDRARREERARVRVLEWGSVPAIRNALQEERFHVLHISCRAGPDALILETADGRADRVGARRLAEEILVPDQGIALVVLAGSSTGLGPAAGSPGAGLPSLAGALLAHGVPAVLAMTSDVSDRYAIELTGQFYQSLASRRYAPDPLAALSDARRELERARRELAPEDPRAALAEWWTPALYLRTESQPLFDPAGASPAARAPDPVRSVAGLAGPGREDFVGRRADLRKLRRVLSGDHPAVIVYGIGGMGKTSLAQRLADVVGEDTDAVLFIRGRTTPTEILKMLGEELRVLRVQRRLERGHELDFAADELTDPRQGWTAQLALVEHTVLPEVSTLIVLDEAEQNIADTSREPQGSAPSALADPELASFIVRWTALGPRARLLVTSRQALELPEAGGRLAEHHLGPLPRGETDKLMWRLEGLGALERSERDRAYADVGGHPRALQYVDSLLRGPRSGFSDVAGRMEAALRDRGITEPAAWLAGRAGDLDQALAETVTLIVDDVLVDRLLARLHSNPLARRLFVAASVFRTPVDENGLNWAVAESVGPPPDPARAARIRAVYRRLAEAQRERTAFLVTSLRLAPGELAQLNRDRAEARRPADRPGLPHAIDTLVRMSLLTLADADLADPHYVVHRWTASGLWYLIRAGRAGLVDAAELTEAHRRAAAYYQWRAGVYPDAVADLLEARYHAGAAGDLQLAAAMTAQACSILFRWGEFDQLMRLSRETLPQADPAGTQASELLDLQSRAAQAQGDFDVAEGLGRDALAMAQARDDARWVALGQERLADIAAARGHHEQAVRAYRTAIDLLRDLQDAVGEARCYQAFGAVALALGDDEEAARYSEAARRYAENEQFRRHHSLKGLPELAELAWAAGDRAAAERHTADFAARQKDDRDLERLIGQSWMQTGLLQLRRDDLEEAERAFGAAMKVADASRDRVLAKDCHLQLGRTWQRQGSFDRARDAYLRHIELADKMGDRSGMVSCYHLMGDLDLAHHDLDAAAAWHQEALAVAEQLGQPSPVARAHRKLGDIHLVRGDAASARRCYQTSLDIGRDSNDPPILLASLLQLADAELADGDPAAAEDVYRECRHIAEAVRDEVGLARCQLGLGRVARTRGDYGDAAYVFGQAGQTAVRLRHRSLEADCLLELGITADEHGRAADASSIYQDALRLAEELRDAGRIHSVCRRLAALTHGRWGQHDWHQRAADALLELGYRRECAECHLDMARIIAPLDLELATSYCHRALALVDHDERSPVTSPAHLELARCARRGGAYGQATAACDEAIRLAEGLGIAALTGRACQEGGLIRQLTGDLARAAELHRRALQQAEAAQDAETILASCRDLGRIARRQRRDEGDDSVESWCGRALALAEAASDDLAAVAAAQQLLLSALRNGRPADAERLRARRPELCGPVSAAGDDGPQLARSRGGIGKALTDSGRPDEAVGFTAASCVALPDIDKQSARAQVAVLQRQRAELGAEVFAALLAEHARGEVYEAVMEISVPDG